MYINKSKRQNKKKQTEPIDHRRFSNKYNILHDTKFVINCNTTKIQKSLWKLILINDGKENYVGLKEKKNIWLISYAVYFFTIHHVCGHKNWEVLKNVEIFKIMYLQLLHIHTHIHTSIYTARPFFVKSWLFDYYYRLACC